MDTISADCCYCILANFYGKSLTSCVIGMDRGTICSKCSCFHSFEIAKYQICDRDHGWRWMHNAWEKCKWWWVNALFSLSRMKMICKHGVRYCLIIPKFSLVWFALIYMAFHCNTFFGRVSPDRRNWCRHLIGIIKAAKRRKCTQPNMYFIGNVISNVTSKLSLLFNRALFSTFMV